MHKNQQDDSVNSTQTQKNHRKEQYLLQKDGQPFAQLPSELATDKNVDALSVRVYFYMCTVIDGWKFYNRQIAQALGVNDRRIGKAMQQLEAAGWLTSSQKRDGGKWQGKTYTLHYKLTDVAKTDNGKTDCGKTDCGKHDNLNNINLSNSDCSNNESVGGLTPNPNRSESSKSQKQQPASPSLDGGRQTQKEGKQDNADELDYDTQDTTIQEQSKAEILKLCRHILASKEPLLYKTLKTYDDLYKPSILKLSAAECEQKRHDMENAILYTTNNIKTVMDYVISKLRQKNYNDFAIQDTLDLIYKVLNFKQAS